MNKKLVKLIPSVTSGAIIGTFSAIGLNLINGPYAPSVQISIYNGFLTIVSVYVALGILSGDYNEG